MRGSAIFCAALALVVTLFSALAVPAANAKPGLSAEMKRELKYETELGSAQYYNNNALYLEPDVKPQPGLVAALMRASD